MQGDIANTQKEGSNVKEMGLGDIDSARHFNSINKLKSTTYKTRRLWLEEGD